MSGNIYDIKKPLLKDKKWLIFPDTILSDIRTVDCNDTMEGRCYENITFDECMGMCEKSPECNFGYYIQGAGKRDICVPLLDLGPQNNPIYRIRNKEIYPELADTRTKTFFDKEVYPFPPKQANNVFFMDNFNIQNIETGFWLDKSPLTVKGKEVFFNREKIDEPLVVQLIQIPPNLSAGIQYVRVVYGEDVAINIPTTTLIFRESRADTTKLEWVSRTSDITKAEAFQLIPIDGKKYGDNVLFSDKFAIRANQSFLGVDEHDNLVKLYYSTYEEAKERGHNVTFRFVPQMEGYYCNDSGKCTQVSLSDMKVNDEGIGEIDGIPIGRNPGCWGVCKYKVPGKTYIKQLDTYTPDSDSFPWLPVIVVGIIIVIIIIVVIIERYEMKK